MPKMAVTMTNIKNTKNKVLATDAAPAAIPPKPKTAATIAMTKNIADHLSMTKDFLIVNCCNTKVGQVEGLGVIR